MRSFLIHFFSATALTLASVGWGQVLNTSTATTLLAFQQVQKTLDQQFQGLIKMQASQLQIQTWQQQNALQFSGLQKQARYLAIASLSQTINYIYDVEIPEGATQEFSDYLATQADLFNRFAELHNQRLQNLSASSGTKELLDQYYQQNAAEIQIQQVRGQLLADQAARTSVTVPPPRPVPAGSSPQMAALLTLQDQIMQSQFRFQNQHISDDADTRRTAFLLWQQSNASQFEELNRLSQEIAKQNSP